MKDGAREAADRARRRGSSLGQRSIARVVARLEPREIAQLRTLITAPQAAIAFQGRRALRELLLGRDEEREA